MAPDTVIFCKCQSRNISHYWEEAENLVAATADIRLFVVEDLCAICVLEPQRLQAMLDSSGNKLVVACHPRAIRLILERAGISIAGNIQYIDLLENNLAGLAEKLSRFNLQDGQLPEKLSWKADDSWTSWYPVLDYTRCNSCGQCADFCLFGTYSKESGKVLVANPKNCKNNCPACARICPQVAIVFPKYQSRGAISGSDSFDEQQEQQRLQRDTNAILGSDIYKTLEERKLKRQLIIRQEVMNQAIRERDEALKEHGKK